MAFDSNKPTRGVLCLAGVYCHCLSMHGWRRWRQWWRLASRIAPIQPAGPYVNCYKLSSFICLTRNAGQYISGISIKYPAWVLTRQMWCTLLLPNKMHQVGHTMTLNHANDFVIGPKSIYKTSSQFPQSHLSDLAIYGIIGAMSWMRKLLHFQGPNLCLRK